MVSKRVFSQYITTGNSWNRDALLNIKFMDFINLITKDEMYETVSWKTLEESYTFPKAPHPERKTNMYLMNTVDNNRNIKNITTQKDTRQMSSIHSKGNQNSNPNLNRNSGRRSPNNYSSRPQNNSTDQNQRQNYSDTSRNYTNPSRYQENSYRPRQQFSTQQVQQPRNQQSGQQPSNRPQPTGYQNQRQGPTPRPNNPTAGQNRGNNFSNPRFSSQQQRGGYQGNARQTRPGAINTINVDNPNNIQDYSVPEQRQQFYYVNDEGDQRHRPQSSQDVRYEDNYEYRNQQQQSTQRRPRSVPPGYQQPRGISQVYNSKNGQAAPTPQRNQMGVGVVSQNYGPNNR